LVSSPAEQETPGRDAIVRSVEGGGEGVEDPIPKPELLFDWKRWMPEDALIQLAGLTSPTASVREREVVEDEQFARTSADLDLYGLQMQVPPREELGLRSKARELGTAEELWHADP